MLRALTGPALAALLGALGPSALAQSMAPMQGELVTFSDTVAVKLLVGNPASQRVRFTVSAHASDWSALPGARASRRAFSLAPGGRAPVLLALPMSGAPERLFRVCVTSQPVRRMGGSMRGQVCGKYRAVRRQP